MIEIRFCHDLGAFRLDVDLVTEAGVIALFGPSGAGKTSIIKVAAGLIRPAQAYVRIGERVLTDTKNAIFVPPEQRKIGYVFQEGRLFPHMSVRQNLLYGRFFAGLSNRGEDVEAIIALLGIGHLIDKRPGQLSGGEKSRVAIGRALLSNPQLLIMDEPLASLDQDRKAEILPFLKAIRDQRKVPILYVSHSKGEVRQLADHIVLVNGGRIVAEGDRSLLDTRGYEPD